MPDAEVIVAMTRFKQDLLRKESAQMHEMAQRWLELERSLESQIAALAEQFARRRADGETLTQGALFRMERYQALLAQLQTELRNYTDYAETLIEGQQRAYAQLAIQHAATAIDASITTRIGAQFDRLPIEAVEHMVGLAGDGSPLRQLLVDSWPDAAQGLTQELIRSTALGVNPRETARRMANGTTRTLNRMLNVSRTEQMRVYRHTALQSYTHSGVVRGYRRLATRDPRTCVGCLASDGEEYTLDVPFKEHASGRCTPIPVVIGMPTPKPQESTEQWFNRQPETTQRSILGRGRYDLWKSRQVGFKDFATVRHNDTWGDAIVPATLGELTQ